MSRFLPGSLAGRLSLLLLVVLVCTEVMAFMIFTAERSRVRLAVTRTQETDRLATLVRVIDALPKEFSNDVVRAFGSRRHQYWTSKTPLVATSAMGNDERQVAQQFQTRLGKKADDARVILVKRPLSQETSDAPALPYALQISAHVADGDWLNGEALVQLPAFRQGERIALPLIAVSALSIVVVAIFAARLIAHPLRALADAADSVGRGEAVAPLAVTGPNEVSRIIHAFNLMQQTISRFLVERLAMLAAISHDLRTPLTALQLRAEMIDDPEVKDAIIRSLTNMQHIAETTLDFASDETRPEKARMIDLASLVEAVAEDSRGAGHNVIVRTHDPLPFCCKPTLLRRALTNLISNANKYGKRAFISLGKEDNRICIMIDDEGPGVPQDQLEKVFEPFVRLDQSRNNEIGGTGLGLSIARSVVRAQGGELSLANLETGLRAKILFAVQG